MLFLQNMYTVFLQVVILAVMMFTGFFADKSGIFTQKASRAANNLLFYIITPCVIINSFLNVEFSAKNVGGLALAAACATVLHLLGIVIVKFMYNKGDADKNAVYKYASMYGNMGYMGLPLSKAVLDAITGNGDIGVFYCSIACAIFNIFAFTHGVTVMSKTKEKFDIKKLIVNPGALGVLIGLPLFLLKVPLPSVIATPISSIGAMNTPLAMIMLGTYLANANLKDAFSHKNIYIASFTKLILMPALLILGFYVCGVRGDLLITASVFVSAPSATNTAMFAAKYDRDTSVASQVSGFTTLLCTFTMPVFVAIGAALA